MVPGTRAVSWLLVLALGACAPGDDSPLPGEAVMVQSPMRSSEFHELAEVIGVLSWNVRWRLPRECHQAWLALELVEEDSKEEIAKLDLKKAELPGDGLLRITVGYFEAPEAPGSNIVKVFLGLKQVSKGSNSVSAILEDPFRTMGRSHREPVPYEGDHFVLLEARGKENRRKNLVLRLRGLKADGSFIRGTGESDSSGSD